MNKIAAHRFVTNNSLGNAQFGRASGFTKTGDTAANPKKRFRGGSQQGATRLVVGRIFSKRMGINPLSPLNPAVSAGLVCRYG